MSPVSYSVKFSCFLSKFIVLKSWNRRSKSGSSPSSENSWIRWEKYRFFASTIHQNAWFQVCIFKIFWGGLTQPLPRLLPPLNLSLRLRFGLCPQFTPPTCLSTLSQQKGTRSNTVPQPHLLVFPNTGLKISFQVRSWIEIYHWENYWLQAGRSSWKSSNPAWYRNIHHSKLLIQMLLF